jgi:hypothetical protein
VAEESQMKPRGGAKVWRCPLNLGSAYGKAEIVCMAGVEVLIGPSPDCIPYGFGLEGCFSIIMLRLPFYGECDTVHRDLAFVPRWMSTCSVLVRISMLHAHAPLTKKVRGSEGGSYLGLRSKLSGQSFRGYVSMTS